MDRTNPDAILNAELPEGWGAKLAKHGEVMLFHEPSGLTLSWASAVRGGYVRKIARKG